MIQLLFLHPLAMGFVILLSSFVLILGLRRALQAHFGMRIQFSWGHHVFWGKLALLAFIGGLIFGATVTYVFWGAVGATGLHFRSAVYIICPLAVIGLLTGHYMDRIKKKRTLLPILHGVNNIILVCVAIFQVWTGMWVLQNFVLG